MGDPAVGRAVLAITVEVCQAVDVAQLLEVLVCAVHPTCTKVLNHSYNTET